MVSKWHKPFVVILELAESTLTPLELEQAERRLRELTQEAAVNRLLRLQKQGVTADAQEDDGKKAVTSSALEQQGSPR